MEKTSTRALNKVYLFSSIMIFLISFYPKIEDIWKIILLIVALGFLITTYFLGYTGSINKVEETMDRLEARLDIVEKLLNTLKDIVILNKLDKENE